MADTFAALREHLMVQDNRRAKNLLSLLKQLRHELQLTEDHICRTLASSDPAPLRRMQDKLVTYLRKHDFSDSSITTYRSRLKQLSSYYQATFAALPPEAGAPLGQHLLHYARQQWPDANQQGLLTKLHECSTIPVPTLKRWTQKASKPREQHRAGLETLAQLFGLEAGAFLPVGTTLVTRAVAQGQKQALEREPLPPAPALPDRFQQQLQDLILFKNKARALPLHRASFKLSRRDAVALQGGGRWTSTPDGEVASATSFLRQLDRYLRWAIATHDLTVDSLDLSLLCTVELLEGYIDDCLTHELYGTLLTFLTPLTGLCDPDTGYLSRYHAPQQGWVLADGHATETFTTLADWQAQARYLHQQLKAWIKDARHLHREENHDTENHGRRNIDWLLDRPDTPLQESVHDVRLLVDDLCQYAAQRKGAATLAPLQVAAWLALSLETPLRISNWCAVQWRDKAPRRDDKAPCLWWDAELNCYQLRVPRGWLKNRRGREVEQISAKLTHGQAEQVLDQLKLVRQSLGWCGEYLFSQTRASAARAAGGRYSRTALAKSIQAWTGRRARALWPDRGIEQGINPHALRHFVATYVLEQTGDFRLAATALMDSVAVVMNVYGKNDHSANQRRLGELQAAS